MTEIRTSTQAATTAAPSEHDLVRSLAAAVLSVPGVVRLEPTRQRSLRRLMTTSPRQLAVPRRTPSTTASVDGITLSRPGTRDGRPAIQVSIDVAVSDDAPALDTAAAVHAAVTAHLRYQGCRIGLTCVNVLSIEPATNRYRRAGEDSHS